MDSAQINAAVATVIRAAQQLADLPPPGPEWAGLKDNVGFSASTDSPMRAYLADVATYGVNGVPLEAHEMAARALGQHRRTQLAGAGLEQAARTLSTAVKLRAAPAEGNFTYFPLSAGSAKVGKQQDGEYSFDPKTGMITMEPVYRKGAPSIAATLRDAGIENRAGYAPLPPGAPKQVFRGPQVGYVDAKGAYQISIRPQDAIQAASEIQVSYPALAAALRHNAAAWSRLASGQTGATPPTPEEVINAPAPAASSSTKTREPVKLDPHGGTAGGISWAWDGGRAFEINLPREIPIKDGAPFVRDAGIVIGWSASRKYWAVIDIRDALNLAQVFEDKGARNAANVLRGLAAEWTRPGRGPTPAEIQAAITLYRRLRWTLPSDKSAPIDAALDKGEIPDAIIDLVYVMKQVRPGDRKADVTPNGSFRMTQDGLEVLPPRTVDAYMFAQSYRWLSWKKTIDKLGKNATAILVPPKKIPWFLRELAKEPGTLPLDFAIRIAFLMEPSAAVRSENDGILEILSVTPEPSQIIDPAAKAVVDQTAARVRLAPGLALRPFQTVGVAFLEAANGRAIVGDQPGLGKTPQALAYLSIDPARTPTLVVCPATVVDNWVAKAKEFVPQYLAYQFSKKDPKPKRGDIVVISYDAMWRVVDKLANSGFQTVIFDESHKIKNKDTARSKAAYDIAVSIPRVILLSGTAIPNKPEDLWMQLRMVDPSLYPRFDAFKSKFADNHKRVVIQGDEELVYDDDRADTVKDELRDALRTIMVRRLKSDVFRDLPPVSRIVVPLKLDADAWRTYKAVEDAMPAAAAASWRSRAVKRGVTDIKKMIRAAGGVQGLARRAAMLLRIQGDNPKFNDVVEREAVRKFAVVVSHALGAEAPDVKQIADLVLFQLGRLRRASGQVKIPQAVEWIVDFLEENEGRPLVVVAAHREVVRGLLGALAKAGVDATSIQGETSQADRKRAISEFQNGQKRVIVITKAAAEGVDLDAADSMVFVERYWTPAEEEQLGGRISRPAKKVQKTFEYYLEAHGPTESNVTTDQRMAALIASKREMVRDLIRDDEVLAERATADGDDVRRAMATELAASVFGDVSRALASTSTSVSPSALWRGYWSGDVSEGSTVDTGEGE